MSVQITLALHLSFDSVRCDQGSLMAGVIVQSADKPQYGTSGGMAAFEENRCSADQNIHIPSARRARPVRAVPMARAADPGLRRGFDVSSCSRNRGTDSRESARDV